MSMTMTAPTAQGTQTTTACGRNMRLVEQALNGSCKNEWPNVRTLFTHEGADWVKAMEPFAACARIVEAGGPLSVQAQRLLTGMVTDTDIWLRSMNRDSQPVSPSLEDDDRSLGGLYKSISRTAIIMEVHIAKEHLANYDGGFGIDTIAYALRFGYAAGDRIATKAILSLPALERMLAAAPDEAIPQPEKETDLEGTTRILSPLIALAEHMSDDTSMAGPRIRTAILLKGGWQPILEQGISDGTTPEVAARYPSRVYDTTAWVASIIETLHTGHTPTLKSLAPRADMRKHTLSIAKETLLSIAYELSNPFLPKDQPPTPPSDIASTIAYNEGHPAILKAEYAGEAYIVDRILTLAGTADRNTLRTMHDMLDTQGTKGLQTLLDNADRYGADYAMETMKQEMQQQ